MLKKFGTKLEKVDGFDKPDIQAQFDANTNTIKYKDDVTEYIMSHESFHAEEMSKIGFDEYIKDAPLKGVKESDFTVENWQRLYKREKYVYDKMIEHSKYLNRKELKHAENYINIHYERAGKTDNLGNPIKETLPFKLDDIPKKRQEVNIDLILNLK